MKPYLIDLLKTLEERIPPPPHCHHAITYARYGCDELGWDDRLALKINNGGTLVCLFLDEEDFTRSITETVSAVAEVLKNHG